MNDQCSTAQPGGKGSTGFIIGMSRLLQKFLLFRFGNGEPLWNGQQCEEEILFPVAGSFARGSLHQ